MKRIIWKRTDGGISIEIPNYAQKHNEETEEIFITRLINKNHEGGWICVAITDEHNIPSGREFRNAWIWDKDKTILDVDFDKAKEITKNRLRAERKPLLEALDVETMKNITNRTKLVEIEAQKHVLRDVTGKVDECKTLEELKSLKVDANE